MPNFCDPILSHNKSAGKWNIAQTFPSQFFCVLTFKIEIVWSSFQPTNTIHVRIPTTRVYVFILFEFKLSRRSAFLRVDGQSRIHERFVMGISFPGLILLLADPIFAFILLSRALQIVQISDCKDLSEFVFVCVLFWETRKFLVCVTHKAAYSIKAIALHEHSLTAPFSTFFRLQLQFQIRNFFWSNFMAILCRVSGFVSLTLKWPNFSYLGITWFMLHCCQKEIFNFFQFLSQFYWLEYFST